MLVLKELDTLLSLLAEEKKSFDTISQRFHKSFARPHQFKAACTTCVLLDEQAPLAAVRPPQRLAGFFCLYDLHRTDPIKENPFLELFMKTIDSLQEEIPADSKADKHTPSAIERQFLITLITSPTKVRQVILNISNNLVVSLICISFHAKVLNTL